MPKRILVGLFLLTLIFQSCESGGLTAGSGNTFEITSVDSITINDIVTDASFPVTAPVTAGSFIPYQLFIGATTEYYHGRYILNNGGVLNAGRMSFKIVKNNNSSAFFADWKIHNRVDISDPDTSSSDGTEVDLDVTATYSSTSNSLFISNEPKRLIKFKVSFGAGPIADVSTGAGIVSSDFSTIVGGNDNFVFIASRGTSEPDAISDSDLIGSWGSYRFVTSGGSNVSTKEILSETYGSKIGDSLPMNADNTTANFSGEAKLINSDIGVFIYAEDSFGINLSSIDGLILIGPSKDLMLRFDLNTDQDYWACDKFQ